MAPNSVVSIPPCRVMPVLGKDATWGTLEASNRTVEGGCYVPSNK